MLPALPQPHQVARIIPSTSPIAQPVRQCRVAVAAIFQERFMAPTIYPLGVCIKTRTPEVRDLADSPLHRVAEVRHHAGMALEHALLVALREQPASGLELARRFGRS